MRPRHVPALCVLTLALACPDAPPKDEPKKDEPDPKPEPVCVLEDDVTEAPAFLTSIGCARDFELLSSPPLVAGLPGARSVKTVIDRLDDGALYFQDSLTYPTHWAFARAHLSGNGKPIVGELAQFNDAEYTSPDRRFVLGAVTYYEGPALYVYEVAPYDAATAEMVASAFFQIEAAFFGALAFHPTSNTIERLVPDLPASIPIVTTDELYAGIDYQPLNLGESYGKLKFLTPADLETGYVDFQDIVVLQTAPNDISVVAGTITQDFQTPLAHINVLAQNRGTPNMGLKGALENDTLRALEGQWIHLVVGAHEWSAEASTEEEADLWFEANRPAALQVPALDLSVQQMTEAEDLVDLSDDSVNLRDAIKAAIPAFGGKASHFSVLRRIEEARCPDGFAIPVYFYWQHLEQHGLLSAIDDILADPDFDDDPALRDATLAELRGAIQDAPVDPAFLSALDAKLRNEYPGLRMRFRSSTNAEDLEGFTGAGLYTSMSGEPGDPERPLDVAVRTVWASVWSFRAFEERRFRGIDHTAVGMALLVHPSFTDELANGVALTANLFDPSGLEPGYFINVQAGESSVVAPPPGVTTDQLLYQYERPGQPAIYYSHSSLVPEGETVLSEAELVQLGQALFAIHQTFAPAYGPGAPGFRGFYAMDVELKLEAPASEGAAPTVSIKQARPHPGRGEEPE
jgi:pyruvate, water dikinase